MADAFTEPLADALRRIQVFEDLDAATRDWLVARMSDDTYEAGLTVGRAGDPADRLSALIAGELQVWQPNADEPMWVVHPGDVAGLLPYSRMAKYPGDVRTSRRSRVAWLPREHFPELLRDFPRLGERLVWLMADRIRSVAVSETHREKLAALGKLSAGLAHELNNPAAAVQRAAAQLCTLLNELQTFDVGAAAPLADRLCSTAGGEQDALDRSDRERALRQWSRGAGYDVPRDALGALADAGLDASDVGVLVEGVPTGEVASLIVRLTMAWRARTLVTDIEDATRRITELVTAIKDYAYRDEMPRQAVDVRVSLDRTLKVFTPRIKRDVSLERQYDDDLPTVEANAGELTQVWTNLIDNALDAMGDKGTLRVRVTREGGSILVEIGDDGPGIAPEIERKVFEPFFTTKKQGEGTGLGLDIVRGIVRRHHGGIRILHSRPGDTVLQVRLPIGGNRPAEEETHGDHVRAS